MHLWNQLGLLRPGFLLLQKHQLHPTDLPVLQYQWHLWHRLGLLRPGFLLLQKHQLHPTDLPVLQYQWHLLIHRYRAFLATPRVQLHLWHHLGPLVLLYQLHPLTLLGLLRPGFLLLQKHQLHPMDLVYLMDQ
jgi:hypothetical protein